MDCAPVNWEALDTLLVDFINSENLVEDGLLDPSALSSPSSSSSPSSLSSSSYRSRLIIRQIRSSIESGDIEAAVDLIRTDTPFVLDDRRLLFRLQKQKFIELLRRGTADDRDAAIDCLRTSLAPCALDAYPEAYEEFKHVLLAFIYDKDDQTSPVANEWAERRRFEIAGMVSSVLRACLHAYDPVFTLTLRYLISIHKGFCFHQGIASPISDLTERLLLEERDAPATPQESLYEAPPFDEVDIQALAHAVELTRQGAIDSLRFAKGDLFQAFQNELCRMNIDLSVLDELVKEYCVYRGIVEPEMQAFPNTVKGNPLEAGYCSSEKSLEMDPHIIEHYSVENLRNDSLVVDSLRSNTNETRRKGGGFELRCTNEGIDSYEDCSTSWSHQCEQSRAFYRSKATSTSERIKRKRWKARNDGAGYSSVVSFNECTKQDGSTDVSNEMQCPSNSEGKYEIVLGLKELAGRGMAAEVVDQISEMDPNFFKQNPLLLFQLKQVEFLRLVSTGDHSSALKVACTYLGPLAANDSSLLKSLKETLLVFLQPNVDAPVKGLPLNALATSLQVAISRRMGIEEPQLIKIMRATLHTHTEWFKLQMCKDRFESLLRINSLKDVDTHLVSAATSAKSDADSCAHGSSQATTSSSTMITEDGSSSTRGSSRDVLYDENSILKVMEFLALPRSDAIQLLAQYNGNAEMVIQQLFA